MDYNEHFNNDYMPQNVLDEIGIIMGVGSYSFKLTCPGARKLRFAILRNMPNVPLNSDEELGATISHIYDVEFYDQDIDLNIDFALTPSDAAWALILAIALLAA